MTRVGLFCIHVSYLYLALVKKRHMFYVKCEIGTVVDDNGEHHLRLNTILVIMQR